MGGETRRRCSECVCAGWCLINLAAVNEEKGSEDASKREWRQERDAATRGRNFDFGTFLSSVYLWVGIYVLVETTYLPASQPVFA